MALSTNRSKIPLICDIWIIIFHFLPVSSWGNTRKSCFLFNQMFKDNMDPILIEKKDCVECFGRYIDRVEKKEHEFDVDYFITNSHFPIMLFYPKIQKLIEHTKRYEILFKLIDNGVFFNDNGRVLGNILLYIILQINNGNYKTLYRVLLTILTSNKIYHGVQTVKYRKDIFAALSMGPSKKIIELFLHQGRTVVPLDFYENSRIYSGDYSTYRWTYDILSKWKRERTILFEKGLVCSIFTS